MYLLHIPRHSHTCYPELFYYDPRMRIGNVFSHVCLSVYLSVCLSVFLSVQAITFELLHIETSFLVYRYIFTISRSSLSIKVIGSRSRSYEKTYNFTHFNMLILCRLLKVIIRSRSHIKVKVTSRSKSRSYEKNYNYNLTYLLRFNPLYFATNH